MFKTFFKHFLKTKTQERIEEKTQETKEVKKDSCLRNLEFYDKFIVVKLTEDKLIEAEIERYYPDCDYCEYADIEKVSATSILTINLGDCILTIKENETKTENTFSEIAITHIVNREPATKFKVKIYTEDGLQAVITEPTDIVIDAFKITIE